MLPVFVVVYVFGVQVLIFIIISGYYICAGLIPVDAEGPLHIIR